MDILDNGSLKIQYNRNRYYDQYTGRWLTHDPLEITPNPQQPNHFNAISQYKDGPCLYEYVRSNPVGLLDSFGLNEIGFCVDALNIKDFKYINGPAPPKIWPVKRDVGVEFTVIVTGTWKCCKGKSVRGPLVRWWEKFTVTPSKYKGKDPDKWHKMHEWNISDSKAKCNEYKEYFICTDKPGVFRRLKDVDVEQKLEILIRAWSSPGCKCKKASDIIKAIHEYDVEHEMVNKNKFYWK